jgi:hypothetical protein
MRVCSQKFKFGAQTLDVDLKQSEFVSLKTFVFKRHAKQCLFYDDSFTVGFTFLLCFFPHFPDSPSLNTLQRKLKTRLVFLLLIC